jgi:hypothetical protein
MDAITQKTRKPAKQMPFAGKTTAISFNEMAVIMAKKARVIFMTMMKAMALCRCALAQMEMVFITMSLFNLKMIRFQKNK